MNSNEGEKCVNVNADKAVEIIFDKNSTYDIKDMSMNGIENAQEAFWFLTQILKKGIIYLYKDEQGNVDLDKLTHENFEEINECMHKLGVNVELKVVMGSNSHEIFRQPYIENTENKDLNVAMSYIIKGDINKLESHILLLFTHTKQIVIGYSFAEE